MSNVDEIVASMMKARIIVKLESGQQPYIGPFSGFGFQPHGIGGHGELEVNENGLDLWKRNTLLPEGYELVRVYYGMNTHKWVLVLETDNMPEVRKYAPFFQGKDKSFEEATPVVNIIPGDDKPIPGDGRDRKIQITHLMMGDRQSY